MKKHFVLLLISLSLVMILQNNLLYAQPSVKDPDLKVESFATGLSFPTSMLFLDDKNLLVLEKDGNVKLVSNEILQPQPLLSLNILWEQDLS